ncbi:hypothetical protein TG4357_02675 [Thalassovita gelatinovora]|uniref:Uncharacterized protein n=1 Tax=Thalassovita gelatinovora TaxID=53501 RepID=A0A0P1FFN0_THAGE|nr:hypothetical protein [Thalassovita gelatinovora]QIZ79801.1 hypothetical protein HFZ77_04545 [Thalassovita gelatinovora]CUH66847.1 hypothetical protein TG4357_02675 [Thalassovita gelatinovora]SEQ43838.1 hypothetical protein SAMN04488043_105212 [Thalassovita gelatinovora]
MNIAHTHDEDAALLLAPDHAPLLVLQAAWDRLKHARGQTVDWDRIGEPRHIMDKPFAPVTLDAFLDHGRASRLERIRHRAAQIGHTVRGR